VKTNNVWKEFLLEGCSH